MTRHNLLVSAVVAALCTGILVIFTDIEVGVMHWFNCGPLSSRSEKQSQICR
jgi:hypothetical protein